MIFFFIMSVWLFFKALGKHWFALMGSAIFTAIAVYAAWRGKSNQWIFGTSIVVALALFFVASFQAWNEEHGQRLKTEATSSWQVLADRFNGLEDGGAVVARWNQNSATKQYQWEVMGGSMVLSGLCTELCREAGKRLSKSKSLPSKFPELAQLEDDRDRWLTAIQKILNIGKVRGQTSGVQGGQTTNSEWGEIRHLTGASRVLCLRFSNDEL